MSDNKTSFKDSQFEKTQLTSLPSKGNEKRPSKGKKNSNADTKSHTAANTDYKHYQKVWYLVSVLVLSALGMAVSVYATSHHLEYKSQGATQAMCNIDSTFSCDDIAGSKYSEVLHYPLGVWGFGYFLALFGIALILLPKKPLAFKVESHYATLISLSLLGLLTSLVLAGISFFIIEAVCLTCVMVYVLTLALGGVSLYYVKKYSFPLRLFGTFAPWAGLISAAVLLSISLAGFAQIPKQEPQTTEAKPNPQGHQIRTMEELKEKVKELEKKLSPTPFMINGLDNKTHNIPVALSPYSELGEDYRLGSDNATVQIVEFVDFQCPACAYMADQMKRLKVTYGDSVSIVFKNYPLDNTCQPDGRSGISLHPHACELAQLARCSGVVLGKFWEYHDLVFLKQREIREGVPVALAKEIGLNDAQIQSCLESEDILAKIKDDITLGDKLGVRGTPAVFINGRYYNGSKEGTTLDLVVRTLQTTENQSSP